MKYLDGRKVDTHKVNEVRPVLMQLGLHPTTLSWQCAPKLRRSRRGFLRQCKPGQLT